MKVVFTSSKSGVAGFEEKLWANGIVPCKVDHAQDFIHHPGADLYIDACFDGYFAPCATPILFHAPAFTFKQLTHAPINSARFCAWPGFWERSLWEVAAKADGVVDWVFLISKMGIQVKLVKDIGGLIAPRILCTLINEAVVTIIDGVSGKTEVDTAMKLGTNYPLGPMEWALKIGADEVLNVLEEMSKEYKKYAPHPELRRLIDS